MTTVAIPDYSTALEETVSKVESIGRKFQYISPVSQVEQGDGDVGVTWSQDFISNVPVEVADVIIGGTPIPGLAALISGNRIIFSTTTAIAGGPIAITVSVFAKVLNIDVYDSPQ
jgi:hypothetical protein